MKDRRGVALAAAVFALAIIGALVAGSFFAGRLEQQSGRGSVLAGQARSAAEVGLIEALPELPSGVLEAMQVGTSRDLGTITLGQRVVVRSRITRLTGTLFLIRAEGISQNAAGAALATRALGLLVQLALDAKETGPVARLSERGWMQLN